MAQVKAFWNDGHADDYYECRDESAAVRWLAVKVAAFNPSGPARWSDDHRIVEAERVEIGSENPIIDAAIYAGEPSNAEVRDFEFLIKARGEIRVYESDGA